ncbi:MAG: B12-binding domain-containing radical SAM protein [Thermoanaerobaculaceae bacterium]|jgi:radical SAM superfamily enzyme YgiQ (UPF0313 family)|nr:B12-binding domain-containing radical SAM protein [Thermoanaerobaculaceae bacterium]
MRIDIVVVYVPRYRRAHEKNFVPPITGIHLAALTSPEHEVRVVHQQVEPVRLDTDADLVALSFFSGFAAEAFRLARELRARGKIVVAGGPHATFSPDECLRHVDAVVIGEAESVWAGLLADAARGRLQQRYVGEVRPLDGLPTPRYDLLPQSFFVPRVLQATRGCRFSCSFCSVPAVNPGFRTRPVEEVIADIAYDHFPHWWQRKLVWFWDDNPTADRPHFKELLRRMIPLRRWWLTQASLDIVHDSELLDLMEASGCIGVFLGIESFGNEALAEANKRHNRVRDYRQAIEILHRRGICVMAGFIAGFDHDTPADVVDMADRLQEIGVDVPFLSVLTPLPGTPLYATLAAEGRLLPRRGWELYNGYNVAFRPYRMTADELKRSHTALWRRAFSLPFALGRILRSLRLRPGAMLMSLMMNAFYGLKAARGNTPRDMREQAEDAAAMRHHGEVAELFLRPSALPSSPSAGRQQT